MVRTRFVKNREYHDFYGITRICLLGFKIYPNLYFLCIQCAFLRMQLLRRYASPRFFRAFRGPRLLCNGDAYHQ